MQRGRNNRILWKTVVGLLPVVVVGCEKRSCAFRVRLCYVSSLCMVRSLATTFAVLVAHSASAHSASDVVLPRHLSQIALCARCYIHSSRSQRAGENPYQASQSYPLSTHNDDRQRSRSKRLVSLCLVSHVAFLGSLLVYSPSATSRPHKSRPRVQH